MDLACRVGPCLQALNTAVGGEVDDLDVDLKVRLRLWVRQGVGRIRRGGNLACELISFDE